MHIVLIGDSIFDNASYVDSGNSISDLLSATYPDAKISLLAVDGDVTTDVQQQLVSFPTDATHVFLSCGGNDALRSINVLGQKAENIGGALYVLHEVKEQFRSSYINMLAQILTKYQNPAVCTIYNKVPGISENALAALALFNEVILEELSKRQLPIIDLRVI